MEAITILDHSFIWLFFNGFMALGGAIGTELLIYALDEEKYSINTRKGDIMFAFFFAPLIATFGMPYLWNYADGVTFLGLTMTNGWYNPLSNIVLGLTIDILVKGIRAYFNKKSKELTK